MRATSPQFYPEMQAKIHGGIENVFYGHEREIAKFEEWVEARLVDSGENLVVLILEDEGI